MYLLKAGGDIAGNAGNVGAETASETAWSIESDGDWVSDRVKQAAPLELPGCLEVKDVVGQSPLP
jgi:hypothetical protein